VQMKILCKKIKYKCIKFRALVITYSIEYNIQYTIFNIIIISK